MSVCGLLTAGIATDCANPLIGGVKDNLTLVNLSEILSVTRNSTNPQIIEAITKVTSKNGYVFQGQRSSIDAQTDLVRGKYSIGYDHQLVFRAFGNSAVIKAQLEALAKGLVVGFIENNFRGAAGAGSFEIFGLDAGLYMTAMSSNKSDADTNGAYVITLKTDVYKEPHLPSTLYLTDYSTSKGLYDGLLTPGA